MNLNEADQLILHLCWTIQILNVALYFVYSNSVLLSSHEKKKEKKKKTAKRQGIFFFTIQNIRI